MVVSIIKGIQLTP